MWDAFNVPWQTLYLFRSNSETSLFYNLKGLGIDMLSIYVASATCTLFWRKDFQLFITKILCYHSWHRNSTVNINCLVYDTWPQFTSFKIGFYPIHLNHFTLLLWRKLHYFLRFRDQKNLLITSYFHSCSNETLSFSSHHKLWKLWLQLSCDAKNDSKLAIISLHMKSFKGELHRQNKLISS